MCKERQTKNKSCNQLEYLFDTKWLATMPCYISTQPPTHCGTVVKLVSTHRQCNRVWLSTGEERRTRSVRCNQLSVQGSHNVPGPPVPQSTLHWYAAAATTHHLLHAPILVPVLWILSLRCRYVTSCRSKILTVFSPSFLVQRASQHSRKLRRRCGYVVNSYI